MEYKRYLEDEDLPIIEIYDLSHPTTWKEMMEFYEAVNNGWKICVNCGIPGLGTGFHLEHTVRPGTMQPSIIPTEYLLTRLAVIDLTSITKTIPTLVLSLEAALQWIVLRHDPREPTLLLFNFGWKSKSKRRQCICQIPGLSYDLAEYIATNLSRVVGVATDAPSLESEETREMTSRTVSNVLGRNGVYIIENVNIKRKIPERGCMSLAMPLKMLEAAYVPTRLTVFCPSQKTDRFVTIALKKRGEIIEFIKADKDVDLAEIMN
ncbi:unnamed protein product [Pieris brassicae]|uniref:Uncharacterized protein n=2 Tax=Pieris brassicae TaxID=7116 RepID=A0A9P0T6N9_PIEBR|nr:unnamed protein product [Pieris brassicae]